MSFQLDSITFQRLLSKALAAAHDGEAYTLAMLLTVDVVRYFQNDPQGQIFRSSIQNHQKHTFDLALKLAPPTNPSAAGHAMSSAIRHGFVYAAGPLLPFLNPEDRERMVVESLITQQQNFFDLLFSPQINDNSVADTFSFIQHKHTHDLRDLYRQWKEHWYAQEQRSTIVSQITHNGDTPRARKL